MSKSLTQPYQISLKENASEDELEKYVLILSYLSTEVFFPFYFLLIEQLRSRAKQKVLDQGGRITQEFTLIKGFALVLAQQSLTLLSDADCAHRVEFDDDVVLQLSSNESINVEEDKEVTIS